jgi:hypothetical protein
LKDTIFPIDFVARSAVLWNLRLGLIGVVDTWSLCGECRYMVNLCLPEYPYNGGTW